MPMAYFQPRTGAPNSSALSGRHFPSSRTSEFPLILNTGRTVEHWHTRTKTGGVPILQSLSPRAWLEMNPRDA